MAIIPELTEDEAKEAVIKLLRRAADMIENADYVHIDESVFQVYRGYSMIFTESAKSAEYKAEKESSFSITVDGEIGWNDGNN